MAVFKCKSCGGDLNVLDGKSVFECEFCGVKQTVPTARDEQLQGLFNRANILRMKSEFDKAEQVYEKILQSDDTQSEAYWGLILCKYGIEYVKDPKTGNRIPTCHRTSFDSIISDDDYKSALQYADDGQRGLYEQEAKEIDRIQKEILALSQKEEPYDVFICYKESDENGNRTQDSVIANDIYYQLTNQGFKVFYAAITLEDKLGSAYEPCIFAALNSAKVMLVVGTKATYFNAVWVKNEWSRFLKMMKKDRNKMLIPCYKEIDAYELPEEFAHLQAQDMSKIGFINDIVRGIKKLIPTDAPAAAPTVVKEVVSTAAGNAAPLLKRAFMFLEDGDWERADDFCEQVLNLDPENAMAYVGKLMAELRVQKQEKLKDQQKPFQTNNNFRKALRFGDKQLTAELNGYITHIENRIENARLDGIYTKAKKLMDGNYAKEEKTFLEAAALFDTIKAYKNAKEMAEKCRDLSKDAVYTKAKKLMEHTDSRNEASFVETAKLFERIKTYKDSAEKAEKCRDLAKKARELKELDRLNDIYGRAKNLLSRGDAACCKEAKRLFESIPAHKDAKEMAKKCDEKLEEIGNDETLGKAKHLMRAHTIRGYNSAMEALKQISGWKDADQQIELCKKGIAEREAAARRYKIKSIIKKIISAIIAVGIVLAIVAAFVFVPNSKYKKAVALMDQGQYEAAVEAFDDLVKYSDILFGIPDKKDSEALRETCSVKIKEKQYNAAIALMEAGKYEEARAAFEKLENFSNSYIYMIECQDRIDEIAYLEACKIAYDEAVVLMNEGKYAEAIAEFENISDYEDSAEKISQCQTAILDGQYNDAAALLEEGNIIDAYHILIALEGYKDSAEKANSIYGQYKTELLKNAQIGDYVYFGSYEQDNDTSNGVEEIEWLVLDVQEGKALVISKYALDCVPFYKSNVKVTWKNSHLRAWLNDTFVSSAFTADELAMIPKVKVSADKNPDYQNVNPGYATEDRVFLLSITEVQKYFSYGNDMACESTAYAKANGTSSRCWWWLRSPGKNLSFAACIYSSGGVCISGYAVNSDNGAVRPAMWIDLPTI